MCRSRCLSKSGLSGFVSVSRPRSSTAAFSKCIWFFTGRGKKIQINFRKGVLKIYHVVDGWSRNCPRKIFLFYCYDSCFDNFKLLYCCWRDYYYFSALKVSCNEIRIFVRACKDLWQLIPDPLVNLPFAQLGEKDVVCGRMCVKNDIFKSPLDSCRSVGTSV